MIGTSNRKHICHQFCTDWCSRLDTVKKTLFFKHLDLVIGIFFLTLSFLSCRAYGKHGITAVTREAEAILQALIMINNSIRLSFTSPQPD